MSTERPERAWQKARQCLDAARKNVEINEYETAINRAYYAVFHGARSLLWLKDCHPKTHAGVHRKFNELYVQDDGPIPPEISTILDELEDERIQVDYEIPIEYTPEEIQVIVQRAEKFLKKLEVKFKDRLE